MNTIVSCLQYRILHEMPWVSVTAGWPQLECRERQSIKGRTLEAYCRKAQDKNSSNQDNTQDFKNGNFISRSCLHHCYSLLSTSSQFSISSSRHSQSSPTSPCELQSLYYNYYNISCYHASYACSYHAYSQLAICTKLVFILQPINPTVAPEVPDKLNDSFHLSMESDITLPPNSQTQLQFFRRPQDVSVSGLKYS